MKDREKTLINKYVKRGLESLVEILVIKLKE